MEGQSIDYIKKLVKNMPEEEFRAILDELKKDARKGVQKIVETKLKDINSLNKEKDRVLSMISFDKSFDHDIVLGVDEVGRGPLAGPVVSASVIMDLSKPILYINDSKKLSRAKREELYDQIIENAIYCSISEVDNHSIDKYNILNATFMAMNSSISFIQSQMGNKKIDLILVDGNQRIRNQKRKQELVIKGDSKSYSIACASIIAKVHRDRLMDKFHKKYPMYNFISNAGYGTKEHIEAIRKFGLSPIHRQSFCSNLV